MTRRTLLTTIGAATVLGSRLPAQLTARLPIRKAVLYSMLPKDLSIEERFALAKTAGFVEVECGTVDDDAEAARMLEASHKAGVRIHSVMNRDHWNYPLSSADPAVVAKSVEGIRTSLKNASLWSSDTVLIVPAVVNPQTSYKQAWDRSQAQIRKLIPLAAELKVILAVEEVWNKFLLSPLEFATYVDQFESPWVRAYFDVGNVVLTGYPQDWIRTLGPRIVKLHLKDFTFRQNPELKRRVASWVMLREGEIDWKEIYRALAEIGYHGSATVELEGGGEDYLRDVNRRVDLILNGA